jgi:hypothetical protein
VKRKLNLCKKHSLSDFKNEKDDNESNAEKITKSIVQEDIKRTKNRQLKKRGR